MVAMNQSGRRAPTPGKPGGNLAEHDPTITKTASGLNVVAGIWLIVSPFILGYSGIPAAMWTSVVIGAIVLMLAWVRIFNVDNVPSLSWINALLGLWLIVTPWVFQFAMNMAPVWNDVILGIIVAVLGTWSALSTPTPHVMT